MTKNCEKLSAFLGGILFFENIENEKHIFGSNSLTVREKKK
jgi:hypothetical protein